MLKQILANGWFFSFIVGWVIFFLLVDWKQLKKNVWIGAFACILQLFQDVLADISKMYHVNDPGIPLLKTSAFFTFGITFTIGVIYAQFLPRNPWLQLIHVLFFSISFTLFEYILVDSNLLTHENWMYLGSFVDNILIMSSFAWTKKFIYKV